MIRRERQTLKRQENKPQLNIRQNHLNYLNSTLRLNKISQKECESNQKKARNNSLKSYEIFNKNQKQQNLYYPLKPLNSNSKTITKNLSLIQEFSFKKQISNILPSKQQNKKQLQKQIDRLNKINKNFQVQYIELSKAYKNERIVSLSLKEEVQKLREAIFRMQNVEIQYGESKLQNRKLQQKLYETQILLNSSQQQKIAYKRTIQAQKNQRSQVFSIVEQVQMVNKELKDKIKNLKQINCFLSNSVSEKNKEIEHLQNLHSQVKKEIQAISEKFTQKLNSLQCQSKQKLQQLQQKHKDQMEKIQVLHRQQLTTLHDKIIQNETSFFQNSQEIQKLKMQIRQLSNKCNELEQSNRKISQRQFKLSDQVQKKQNQIKQLLKQLEQLNQSTKDIRRRSIQQKVQCDFIVNQIKNKLETIQEQNQNLNKQLQNLKDLISINQQAKLKQQHVLAQLEEQRKKTMQLTQINDEICEQLQCQQKNLKQIKQQNQKLKDQNALLLKQKQSLQNNFQTSKNTQKILREQIKLLQGNIQNHLIQVQKQKSDIGLINLKANELNIQIQNLTNNKSQLQSKLQQSQQKIIQITETFNQFNVERTQVEKRKQQIQFLKHQREEMTIQITLLQSQIANLQERIKVRSPTKSKQSESPRLKQHHSPSKLNY